jgi:phosphoribosylglycinamide formyltransferase-1
MTNKKIRTAILISGRGSNMQALINATKESNYPASISVVISNKADAKGLEFAQRNNIKTAVIDNKKFNNREDFDKKLSQIIDENNCQMVCLAGFMRLLSKWFTDKYKNRLINIHPSILPNFKGANAVCDALKSGFKESGCTTHFVTEQMDSGEIIMQSKVKILEDDNEATLANRILKQEHIIYPKSLEIICNKILKN